MKPFARIKLSSVALRTGILVSSIALAAGCCTVDRTGEYYVATKTLTGQARCPDGLIPSVGALLAMIGAEYPFPFIVLAPPWRRYIWCGSLRFRAALGHALSARRLLLLS